MSGPAVGQQEHLQSGDDRQKDDNDWCVRGAESLCMKAVAAVNAAWRDAWRPCSRCSNGVSIGQHERRIASSRAGCNTSKQSRLP